MTNTFTSKKYPSISAIKRALTSAKGPSLQPSFRPMPAGVPSKPNQGAPKFNG